MPTAILGLTGHRWTDRSPEYDPADEQCEVLADLGCIGALAVLMLALPLLPVLLLLALVRLVGGRR